MTEIHTAEVMGKKSSSYLLSHRYYEIVYSSGGEEK